MTVKKSNLFLLSLVSTLLINGCNESTSEQTTQAVSKLDSEAKQDISNTKEMKSFYGTTEPFASEAVYFLMTDRFVDGDPSNNFEDQGGEFHAFDRPLVSEDGRTANVGYLGGDFKGIIDNADYIKEMGFTSIWLTPIVEQPNFAFNGGEPIEFGGMFRDGGKTAYHGYWGINFYKVDERLKSDNFSFEQLTTQLKDNYQIKTILDVVANHGSPSFSMPEPLGDFGKLYDKEGNLIADHQNIEPENLDLNNPLHQMFNTKKDIMQLSDFNENSPQVLDYFTNAYLQWIDQGAHAFRIDTIKHMPHDFWKKFTDRIREQHPNFFMFAESFSFDANFIAEHTQPENGGISVLDFPGRETMLKVFENPESDYSEILSYLFLTDSPYANPYELMTFYDNHDMSRINTSDEGFIDLHNWLFTSRGIPVLYYGSEIGFMRGRKEHEGNRNYYGTENIEKAKEHPIRSHLIKIANLRKSSIALQKGLQVNLEFSGNKAAFYRVYQHQGVNQTALVLLNKGDNSESFSLGEYLSEGDWKTALGSELEISNGLAKTNVEAHGISVYILNQENTNQKLLNRAVEQMNKSKKVRH